MSRITSGLHVKSWHICFESHKNKTSDTVDDKKGKDIPDVFADKYSKLFSEIDEDDKIKEISKDLNDEIANLNINETDLINEYVVREAISKVAPNKTDATLSISSNNFLFGSELLISWLTILYREILIHNHIPDSTLLAKILPLIKDKCGDEESPITTEASVSQRYY